MFYPLTKNSLITRSKRFDSLRRTCPLSLYRRFKPLAHLFLKGLRANSGLPGREETYDGPRARECLLILAF